MVTKTVFWPSVYLYLTLERRFIEHATYIVARTRSPSRLVLEMYVHDLLLKGLVSGSADTFLTSVRDVDDDAIGA
jgi:hypothetical protein